MKFETYTIKDFNCKNWRSKDVDNSNNKPDSNN